MDELHRWDKLQVLLSETDFVAQTQEQIAKDFSKFSLYLSNDTENRTYSIAELKDVVATLLTEIMRQGEARLLQLLYTIDIPEKEFLNLIDTPDFLNKLSEKIILREAYKVYLRTMY